MFKELVIINLVTGMSTSKNKAGNMVSHRFTIPGVSSHQIKLRRTQGNGTKSHRVQRSGLLSN